MKKHLSEVLFADFISGSLSEEKKKDVLNHLSSCRKCSEKLALFVKVSNPYPKYKEDRVISEIFPQPTEEYSNQLLHLQKLYSNNQGKSGLQIFSNLLKVTSRDFISSFNLIYNRKRILIPSIVILLAFLVFLINPIGKYMDHKAMVLIETGNALLSKSTSPIYTIPLRPYGGFSWVEYSAYRGKEHNKISAQENDIEAFFKEALKIRKNNPEVLSYTGNFYLVLGNFTQARYLFERAMKLKLNNAIAANGLGIIYYAKNEIDKAIEFLLLAKKSDPQFLEARYNLAFLYQQIGKYQEARKEWQEYLKMDSYSEWADNARDMLKKIE